MPGVLLRWQNGATADDHVREQCGDPADTVDVVWSPDDVVAAWLP